MSKNAIRQLLKQNRSAIGEAILSHMLRECENRNHLSDDYDPMPRVLLPRVPSTNHSGNTDKE